MKLQTTNKFLYKVGLLVPAFFYFVGLCIGQQYSIKNYSVNDGLPQSQVFGITQDREGYLWLGTKGGGIVRFDGNTFTPFFAQSNIAFVNKIEQAGNRIFIAHTFGYAYYDQSKRELIQPNHSINQKKAPVSIILPLPNDSILISTTKNVYIGTIDNPVRIDFNIQEDDDVPGCAYYWNGKIYLGNNYGVHVISYRNGRIGIEKIDQKQGLKTKAVRAFLDYNNELYIGTYGGGLYIYNGNTIRPFHHPLISEKEIVQVMYKGSRNDVWIGTNNGIIKHSANNNGSYRITEKEGLCRNNIVSITEDDWGNYWFGSSGGGISRYNGELFTNYNSKSNLPFKNVYTCIQTPDSSFWIGSSVEGILQLKNGNVNLFNAGNGFTNAKVKSLCYHKEKNILLIGTEGDGFWTYDFNTFSRPEEINQKTGKWVKQIIVDASKNTTIATASGGVVGLDSELNVEYHLNKKNVLSTNRINTVQRINQQVWMGTEGNGIILFDLATKYSKTYSTSNHLPTNTVRSLVVDQKNRLWIGTPIGLGYYYLPDPKKFYAVKTNKNFTNIYLLGIEKNGILAGTAQGLVSIKEIKKDFFHTNYYGANEGFDGIECSQNAVSTGLNNTLLIGTINGMSIMRSDYENNITTPPYLSFTHINLFYNNILSSSLLEQSIVLNPEQNHLGFKFKGINLSNPDGVNYQWKLEGLEEKWSPLTSTNEVNYTNLVPGKYTFKVRARSANGIWTTSPLQFSFEVNKHWYNEGWFYTIAILTFILLLILTYSLITRRTRLQQQREKQRLMNENRILELQQMALRLQMNPHFIFNCLNSIQNLINQNRNEDANFYIREFSGLMRGMVDQTPKETIRLDQEINLLVNYLELEKLNRSQSFDYTITTKLEDETDFYKIPPLLLQPFAENAIVHGFKGIQHKGILVITIQDHEQGLLIEIKDNGTGFIPEELEHAKGSALRITNNRLELFHRQKGEWVKFESSPGNGTTVTVQLKEV